MPEFPNPYKEKRKPSKGEVEVEMGSLLRLVFTFLKVPTPAKGDAEAVERTGQLLQRRFPWMAQLVKVLTKKR